MSIFRSELLLVVPSKYLIHKITGVSGYING